MSTGPRAWVVTIIWVAASMMIAHGFHADKTKEWWLTYIGLILFGLALDVYAEGKK